MPTLGEKLKSLRTQNGIVPARVAWEIGVGRSMILRYENGDKIPPQDKLELLAKYFKVDIDYLQDSDPVEE